MDDTICTAPKTATKSTSNPRLRLRQRPSSSSSSSSKQWSLCKLALTLMSLTSSASAFAPLPNNHNSRLPSTPTTTTTTTTTTSCTARVSGSSIADGNATPFAVEFPPRWSPLAIRRSQQAQQQQVLVELPTFDFNIQARLQELRLPSIESSSSEDAPTTQTRLSSARNLPLSSAATTPFPLPSFFTNSKSNDNKSSSNNDNVSYYGAAMVGIGVLLVLSLDGDSPTLGLATNLETAAMNIVDTTVPASTYDIVAVALGETLAGLTGAAASLSLNLLLANTQKLWQASTTKTSNSSQNSSSSSNSNENRVEEKIQKAQGMINQAAAESDYFLARAALLPILESVGLSPALATLASTLFATLPYGLVKLGKAQRSARQQENIVLQQLLTEQLVQQQGVARRMQASALWNVQTLLQGLRQELLNTSSTITNAQLQASKPTTTGARTTITTRVDPSTLKPVQEELEPTIDGVELFADTCKWLSYSVLMKTFFGSLAWQDGIAIGGGVESGFYGLLATLTSQIYGDFLYGVVQAGPKSKQDQVRNRAAAEWVQLYVSKSISAFTLFGVYASVQLPVRIAVNALLSGGVDSCIGSVNVDMCMETYYMQNPPPPSADVGAQLRAIATTIYSFSMVDTTFMDGASADAQVRAVITTLVSLSSRIF